jgi:hypothetical protein
MNDDFEKIAWRMERDALRLGGPADTPISVPCKSCGKATDVAMRRFTLKRKPRCAFCGGPLDEEAARKLIVDAAISAGRRLQEILKQRHQ